MRLTTRAKTVIMLIIIITLEAATARTETEVLLYKKDMRENAISCSFLPCRYFCGSDRECVVGKQYKQLKMGP